MNNKYSYISAPPGAGKSYWAADRMMAQPARYLVVRDRKEAIAEYKAKLEVQRNQRGLHIHIDAITSDAEQPVRSTVANYPCWHDDEHIILLITHAAMMMSDLSEYAGWHIIIDETPAVFDQQVLTAPASNEHFARLYNITSLSEDWHAIIANETGVKLSPAEIGRDTMLAPFRQFHERVLEATAGGRAVVCDLADWADAKDGRQWTWWSAWSLTALEPFVSVTFMANAFAQSLTYAAFRALHPSIEWQLVDIAPRPYKRRTVVIEYFAQGHTASRYLFDHPKGKQRLNKIARHLADRSDQIWTCNERFLPSLEKTAGQWLKPIQAGSNAFMFVDRAAMIYSAKPSTQIQGILDSIGIEPAVWTETNEHEVILQFICRTSVRDPDSDRPVHFTVYDEAQASYLASFFRAQPHCDIKMVLTDLGFAETKPNLGGRPRVERTPDKIAADKAKRAKAAR